MEGIKGRLKPKDKDKETLNPHADRFGGVSKDFSTSASLSPDYRGIQKGPNGQFFFHELEVLFQTSMDRPKQSVFLPRI